MEFIHWRGSPHQPRHTEDFNHVPWGIEVHHTVTQPAKNAEELIDRMRQVYRYHVHTLGWWDFWYNFAIALDGSIAEGRGWEHASYADDGGPDSQVDRLTVVLVGNYQHDEPTDAQRRALHALEAALVERGGGTDHSYHRVRSKTACPGDNVVNQWHWLWAKPAPPSDPDPEPKSNEGDIDVSALPTLREGDGGDDAPILERQQVRNVQGFLISHAEGDVLNDPWYKEAGIKGWVDGDFGPATRRVLETWQERTKYLAKHELGFVGPRTWRWFLGVPQ